MTPAEYRAWNEQQRRLKSSRAKLIWLFIGSVIGVTAPVLGPIAGIYAHVKRRELAGPGGTYLAMGYASAAMGIIYTGLLAAVALGA